QETCHIKETSPRTPTIKIRPCKVEYAETISSSRWPFASICGVNRRREPMPRKGRSMATIFKVTTAGLWAEGQRTGEIPPSPVDERDGFVHFSTAAQLAETLRLHFAGQSGLMLLWVDTGRLGRDLVH